MADYDWPTALRPASVEWGLIVPQLGARSAMDGSVQAQTFGAPRWFFNLETGPLKSTEVPQWEALILKLRGRVNRVRCWDWRRESPLGTAGGTPLVNTSAAGATLSTKGWTANQASLLLAGSYFKVNGELKKLTETAASNASGQSTLTFEPPLRVAPAVNAPLTLTMPTANFILVSERPAMPQRGARHPGLSLSFEEDLRP